MYSMVGAARKKTGAFPCARETRQAVFTKLPEAAARKEKAPMRKVVSEPKAGQAVFIGLDISRSKWVFNVRWDGEEQRRFTSPGELRHLQAVVEQYRGCQLHVTYEACGFGYEIAWWLREEAVNVTVVAPSTVERAQGLRVKTDRLDARTLADKLEKGSLKSVHIPTREDHDRRQLSRTYAQALQDRKRAQARVRSLLQEQGRIGPAPSAGWKVYRSWLGKQRLPEAVSVCVTELLDMREQADDRAKRLKAALMRVAREPQYAPVVKALETQPGVGGFTAIRMRLELGDIGRFATAGSFVNYLGLTPSEYSSGELVQRGHLVKCGPGYIRAWLVECAWSSIRAARPDHKLRECFNRLRPRVGDKRAIVAVARRLALRLRARWLEAMQPLPQAA
jgi:transposase